ncbi:MAG: glycerate kinase, partial [Lentisphaeria bacterium]|nr:glycerate kinase [Lentisphaeria bacterium]
MKIILAFDSFKNCLSSPEICTVLSGSIQELRPDWQIVQLPLGDGGEGTARAITSALGGSMQKCTVHDPLFRIIEADFGLLPDNTAVLEMASASGIELITRSERDPLRTTTYGTGEMLKYLSQVKNVRSFIICIGGSATVDCGIGLLQALGVEFFDGNDQLLPVPANAYDIAKIRRINAKNIPDAIRKSRICIASDVTNPLCGENGAARIFAPQKGADASAVEFLENNLEKFGTLSVESGLADSITVPGDGAAGGLGFALRNYLHAETTSGAELVLNILDFDKHLDNAGWVITGEGCSDFQTAHGKL